MPFSWKKKTRCNRFSQLVADHLQSPKHGGSLVVETGFPTSLIDLYVRNRGRFRKSSVMKPTENDSINLSSPVSLLDSNNSFSSGYDYKENNEIIEEDVVVESGEMEDENSSEIEVERSVELAKLNPVFVVMLKVLIMLVLLMGTKMFTFGITVSAFLLFLLESVRKQLLRRPSLVDSKTPFESSFREKKNIGSIKENASVVDYREMLKIEEHVESKQEVKSEKELDEARSEDLMEVRQKSCRRAIMKSKMKKLVAKKLRRSSMGSKGEISCEFKEDETVKCVEDIKPLVFSGACCENFSVLKQEYDEIEEIKGRSSSLTYSSEIYCDDNELRMESRQNSGSLVLCLIVLVGLIGGRVLALVLAISWCLMLKKLQWRNVKFPNS